MKMVPAVLLLLLLFLPGTDLFAQAIIDPNFRLAAEIKPKDYPGVWPDSVGAWIIYSNYDVNKNGKKEFFVLVDPATSYTSTSTPTVFWFEATANDTYTLLWSTKLPGSNQNGYSWANMTVGDLDDDGSPEVHVILPRGRTGTEVDRPLLYVYEYDGSTFPAEPTMTSTLTVPDGYRYSSSSVTVANVDADPAMELVVTSRNDDFGGASAGRTMMILSLIGEVGPFSSMNREFIDSSAVLKGGYVFTAYTVDYDRDGKMEIWVPTWDMLSMAIYETTGPDTYALQADINEATTPDDVGEHNGVRFYDADGDGAKEMYWSAMSGDGENPGGVYYIKSTADVSTLTTADVALVSPLVDAQTGNALAGADIGDIDKNGRMDFVCTGATPINKIFRLEYNGSGSPGDVNSYTWTTLYEESAANTGYDFENVSIGDDLDGDGNREVLIANLVLKPGGNDPAIIILEARGSSDVRQTSGRVPDRYRLEQNYPNPFNPETNIEFSLVSAGYVSLRVYDLLGREVATLVSGNLPAGTHRATLDAGSLPSGTYWYTLQAGTFTATKSMMVLK